MRSSPNLIYRLLHRDYPESFAAYSPQTKDFYELVHSQLPENWTIERREMWFYCGAPLASLPLQGWKIHVSATTKNSRETLARIAAVLFKHDDVCFKFAADQSLVSLLNSKSWPRAASGKFITIYPPDNHRFLELIEEVHQATAGLRGPYILSDHRYKSSGAVFYRYGGIRTQTVLNVKGERVPVLKSPDGSLVPDQRLAYPTVPDWEEPVLLVEEEESAGGTGDGVSLMHGRYTIEKAVAFSNSGGVYCGRDSQSGRKVIVKEARPCISSGTEDYDAIELLKKEYRLLRAVADTGIAPQPLDLFQEWEHWFLVEEFIEGIEIGRHSAAHNILLRTRPTAQDCKEWSERFRGLCKELLTILKILHSRNIVFADLSASNLMVTADGQEMKIIDFEGAYQPGVDRPTHIYTPGFASRHRIAGGEARQEDDYYSAGAVLLSYLLPINGLLHLNTQARHEFLASIRNDIDLPASMIDVINQLMDLPESCSSSSAPDHQVEVAETPCTNSQCGSRETHELYQAVLNGVVTHIHGTADYKRSDRLYPADPRIFSTNPLSLAYGASGVVYALQRIAGRVPQAAIDWILQHQVTSSDYPPGLYIGMSGIAWSLLEIGLRERAEEIFRATFSHPLIHKGADLFHGMAGWGMTGLRFFQETGNELYLEQAKDAGNRLMESAWQSDRGLYWPASDERPLGVAHGSSGISLFLLYLYLATKTERYLDIGLQALDFDLSAAVPTKDGGLSWGESVDLPSPLYPYWRFGSAGVGMVTARYERLTGSMRYRSILEQIFIDTDRKYAVLPGCFTGLAGLGEFLLDMYDLRGERRFLQSAHRVAEGIMPFRVERNGTAFPGEMLSRLCCGYGTGSAGVGLFLNRLLGNQKNNFMLDELFSNVMGTHSRCATQDGDMASCVPAV
ncbi:MAG TPA: class III lanthionine synthetase LanKC [Candidatus Angelobacter sp.]